MQVESENLVGTDVKAKVTSCNWNIYQKIEITGEALTSGSFYFLYDAEQTVEKPVNSDGASVKSTLEDLQTINTVTIIDEVDELSLKSWTVRFDSFDGTPKLLYA